MIIVAGHLTVAPAERSAYLDGCAEVVRLARSAPGCLDFAITGDLLEPARVNVYERWASASSLESFRGSGPSGAQQAAILGAAVEEYAVR